MLLSATIGRQLRRYNVTSRILSQSTCYRYLSNYPKHSPLAFAFDIDGVLLRGEHALPEAKRALDMLDGNNTFGLKIPYILMTNGGGVSETDRCTTLSSQLGREISPKQYIQAHTILKSVAHQYRDDPVLVLGGKAGVCRALAEEYGFKNAYTSWDVLAWNPAVWAFHDLTEAEARSIKTADFSKVPFKAIFVFHDPRDWALDTQVMLDVIRGRGVVGGPYLPHPGSADDTSDLPPVEVVFCNPDLIWRSDFERPRLGQGGFKTAFQAVYKALTGYEYPCIQYGKPTKPAYQFAERVMKDRLEDIVGRQLTNMPNVYMVGDNPESDIAGANGAGWSSILVRTGVYDPANGPPAHTPTIETADVEEAVSWAMERELKNAA